jgi:hypothetical protein
MTKIQKPTVKTHGMELSYKLHQFLLGTIQVGSSIGLSS